MRKPVLPPRRRFRSISEQPKPHKRPTPGWPRSCPLLHRQTCRAERDAFLAYRPSPPFQRLVKWIRAVECARRQGKRFLTFGSSRKFGLRRIRRLGARLRIDERVLVGRSDDAPAVASSAEQV